MKEPFPFYQQHDQMDCGPSCLRMIAKFYGIEFTLNDLRSRMFVTREGTSMLSISEAAESIGFKTLAVKITSQVLATEITLPCIAHMIQGHFVVVYKVAGNKVYVSDPAASRLVYSLNEFEKLWLSSKENRGPVGFALLLEPTEEFYHLPAPGTRPEHELIKILRYIKPYKGKFIQLFIGLIVGSLLQLALPFLTQSIVDTGIKSKDINFIYLILAGQLILFFGRTSVEFIRRWTLLFISAQLNTTLISAFLAKLFTLPLAFFDTRILGDILQRIDDHRRIERFISTSTLNFLFSILSFLVLGIVLLVYSPTIFVTYILFGAVYVLFTLQFLRKREELDYKRFTQLSNNQNTLVEIIQGMSEIKLNQSELWKRWAWERIQKELFRLNILSTKLLQVQEIGGNFINELKNIIVTSLAAIAVINDEMTLGMMLSVQFIIGQLNAPLHEFILFTRDFQDAKLSYARISEVHLIKDDESSHEDRSINTSLVDNQSISIRALHFQYGNHSSPKVLENIDLNIPIGRTTAIVGSSASGKTTLVKVLLKFYNYSEGSIEINGQDLNRISAKAWRKKCGVVMQDGYIFSDTISRNIAMTDDESIDMEMIARAARIANILEEIELLPLQFDTKIGNDGIGLSEGQRQRLLIARAVYKNPEFIFFDEGTSSLDARNERIIINNLQEFFRGKTVIVVAHRLSTVRHADQIVVFEKGKIVETGTHVELCAKEGYYFDLIKNQIEL